MCSVRPCPGEEPNIFSVNAARSWQNVHNLYFNFVTAYNKLFSINKLPFCRIMVD